MKFLVLATILLGFASVSFGQSSATGTASSEATILIPISIVKNTDMNFGIVTPGVAIGTVALSTASGRVAGGGASIMVTQTGTVTAAKFTVSGDGAHTYAISLPATVTLTKAGGGATMIVNGFNSNPGATGTLSGTTGTTGSQEVFVGATLNVGASQASGVYSNASDLAVTVNYN